MYNENKYHTTVIEALQKEGWKITDDPLILKILGVEYHIDLGAEKLIAASKGNHQIAVEVKSFTSDSLVYEFHSALGQFLDYLIALEKEHPDRKLFLAIPSIAFWKLSEIPLIKIAMERYGVKAIIYDIDKEEIIQWIQ